MELHRQVGVGSMMRSKRLGGVIVSTLALNARDMSSIPALGTIFPILVAPMTLDATTCHTSYMLVELTLCIYGWYVIVSSKRLTSIVVCLTDLLVKELHRR